MLAEDKRDCCGCGACAEICPVNAVSFVYDEEGFRYPSIDEAQCIHCQKCEEVCGFHNRNITWDAEYKPPSKPSYAVMNSDEKTRITSASGGFFMSAAETILEKGGCVYGTSWTKDWKAAEVKRAETLEDADKFRTSKYVESKIHLGTFKQIKRDLEADRWVLFTGTPCQINAVKYFLGKDYDKLICIDLICEGVPSEKVWRAYIDSHEKAHKSCVEYVNCRDKRHGWHFCGFFVQGSDWDYYKDKSEDSYMKLFFNYSCMRPSCYRCKPMQNRKSDITMADLWGVEKFAPELDDNKGISLVIVQSEKGSNFLEEISDRIKIKEVSFIDAYKNNVNYSRNRYMSETRLSFFKNFDSSMFDDKIL